MSENESILFHVTREESGLWIATEPESAGQAPWLSGYGETRFQAIEDLSKKLQAKESVENMIRQEVGKLPAGQEQPPDFKRYLVFAWFAHEASGGWDDLQGWFDTQDETTQFIARLTAKKFDFVQVVDALTGQSLIIPMEGQQHPQHY